MLRLRMAAYSISLGLGIFLTPCQSVQSLELAKSLGQISSVAFQGKFQNGTSFEVMAENEYSDKGFSALGSDGALVDRRLKMLVVKIANRTIRITEKDYLDLGRVELLGGIYFFRQSDELYELHVGGGDGSGSYSAVFCFSSDKYLGRKISVSTGSATGGQ